MKFSIKIFKRVKILTLYKQHKMPFTGHLLYHCGLVNMCQRARYNSQAIVCPSLNYTVIHNYRTPRFERHNLVNIRFISTKIFTSEPEIMLCEVLSEFPQYVLPLPCNVCVNVTSERRQGDGVCESYLP